MPSDQHDTLVLLLSSQIQDDLENAKKRARQIQTLLVPAVEQEITEGGIKWRLEALADHFDAVECAASSCLRAIENLGESSGRFTHTKGDRGNGQDCTGHPPLVPTPPKKCPFSGG